LEERTLSVLMPVYNEAATVEEAIREVVDAPLPVSVELIVIDDGSTDGTRELLGSREWPDNVSVVFHDRNRGKGAAVRTGLTHATGAFAAIFDADLEYDPKDLKQLVEPLLAGEANAVFGSRAFAGHTSHSFLYVLGNRFVTLVCNVLFNVYIGDIMTCHKAIETELFRSLDLRANGFTIEPEITARLLQAGERIFEVPVRYRARTHPEGKKLTSREPDPLPPHATVPPASRQPWPHHGPDDRPPAAPAPSSPPRALAELRLPRSPDG
jgi:glycosyltransferase involved in cell wall biosynthesis